MKFTTVFISLLCALAVVLLLANLGVRRSERAGIREPAPPPPTFALPAAERTLRPPVRADAPKPKDRDPSRARLGANACPVVHKPQQPRSGEPVLITARPTGLAKGPAELRIEYQIVDPGKYIALHDAAFAKQWVSVPMIEREQATNSPAGERSFTAEIPADMQKHRRLVRYRVRMAKDGKVLAPEEGDAQPNFAYFVYDGVPAWKGAIDPNSRDATVRQPVVFSSDVLQRVPVYHFISSKPAVGKTMWTEPEQFGDLERHQYRYTGTMVYDGVVYDHVGFRARGGAWRHAMGKNMWKFNFLPGHHLDARDDYGNRYDTKWDKLNLGACIQQGDYGMRGEQGMFEAVGFRLFNLAGMEASRTHWIHLRVIDQAEESPRDQYAGDFWGLYLAVENVDEHFLKEHQLPPGNLYKIDGAPKSEFNGDRAVANRSDVNAFMRATLGRPQPDQWWSENVDLARYYRYRSIIECIHHYDVDGGKNYFYYRNPTSGKWIVLPWDIDLTWGDRMYGGGHEPFYRSGILARPPGKQRYQECLAEIRDLLFNPEQTGNLIDEHARMISDPNGGPSLADADRAKWDYNPILASRYVMSSKAGQGLFYFGEPRNTFQSMVKYMKSYAAKRANWIDSRLLSDYRPIPAPKIAADSLNASASDLTLRLNSKPDSASVTCRWRLAEITDPKSPAFNPTQPWKYEIQALAEQETKGSESASFAGSSLSPGHTYRVRARWQDPSSGSSRWSAPVQFTVPPRKGELAR